MRKKHSIYLSVLLSLAMIFVSCDEQLDNAVDNSASNSTEQTSGGNESTETPLPVNVIVTRDGAPLSGSAYTVNTILAQMKLKAETIDLEVADNEYPQVIWVTDENEQTLLLSRGVFTKDMQIHVNEETTALALLTMAPVFTGVTKKDYPDLVASVKDAPSYAQYVAKVKEIIATKKNIFDPANTEVLTATQAVIDEVLAAPSASRTRSGSPIEGFDNSVVEPLKVSTSGNTVYVSVRGMYPSYEGRVYWGGSHEEATLNKMVNTTASLGWLEYVKMKMGNNIYGSETDFKLEKQGEYKFYFDRTTDKSITNFSLHLVSDILSLVGASLEKEQIEIATTLMSLVTDPTATASGVDFLGAVSNAVLSYGMSKNIADAEKASEGNNFNTARYKILGKVLQYYSLIKGGVGLIQRIALYCSPNTPDKIEFTLCMYNNTISTCNSSQVFKVSGDKQEGEDSKKLSDPLVVELKSYNSSWEETAISDYMKVKFEVVSGGGTVTESYATIEPETNFARTEWYLGSADGGVQKVKATAYNSILKMTVGEPIYFTATVKSSDPAPEEIPRNAVDLGLSVLWATCNLGADKPTQYGNYYSWGDPTPKSTFGETEEERERIAKLEDYLIWNPSGMITNFSGTEYDAAYVALGNPWRIPTKEDFKELIQNCTREANVEIDGIKGDRYTASNGNSIFFPYGGLYQEDPMNNNMIKLLGRNQEGRYWTSSCGGDGFGNSPRFFESCNGWGNLIGANQGWEGYNIRPVRSKP